MHVSFLQQFSLATAFATVLVLLPGSAGAQSPLRTEVVASGLSRPVGFVQDPSDPTTQFILQHSGRIRVLKNGSLLPGDFLDLSGVILNSGERGLLGLAFPPDSASSGRFYVSFSATDTGHGAGHTVVARFRRSPGNPLVADPASRFDLLWSAGERFIRQPFDLHKAGHMVFGPDGYLYIATGDGGADGNDAGDPLHRAQDLGSLLGKILRIDVRVGDADPNGFVVPLGNPFVNTQGAAPEIWSIGFRNPWKFSFDANTGAMLIGDVGHDLFEELDYEPAGRPGRNYGWRLREGSRDYDLSLPPAYLPLKEPLLALDRSFSRSIIGGFVYRGQALGAEFAGRYFFADFVLRRVYSIALTVDPTGEATASDLRDHTSDLGGTAALGGISAFGVDAAGEIYVVSFSRGEILRLRAVRSVLTLDHVTPRPGSVEVSGWAIDARALSGSGVDSVHVYAFSDPFGTGWSPIFLGASDIMISRPDVAQAYGARFEQSGFQIFSTRWLPPGPTVIAAYGRSTFTGQFELVATTYLQALDIGQFAHALDQKPSGLVAQPILFSGWALDYAAATAPPGEGTGIRAVYVDILSSSGALLRTIPAAYGLPRPDVAGIFGARFQASGFSATVHDLWPGEFSYRVRYVRNSGGEWSDAAESLFTVAAGPMIAIGAPTWGGAVSSTFLIGGWALDLRSSNGPGVDSVHIWAYPNPGSGAPPTLLGVADYGVFRPDVGAAFGPQFTNSGFNLTAGPLPPGIYDVVVFARTIFGGSFEIYGVVRVTVQ